MDSNVTRKYTVFDDNDPSSEEKSDATPENMKKIDDVISPSLTDNKTTFNYANEQKLKTDNLLSVKVNLGKTGVNNELKIIEDESPTNSNTSNNVDSSCTQNLAFTIDFGNANSNTKYKTMLERFQNRHRRGASMSKLDNNDDSNNRNNSSPIVTKPSKILSSSTTAQQSCSRDSRKNYNDTEAGKVKLRLRERSTSGVRDPSKRHSWSPRSSTAEPSNFTQIENLQQKNKSQQNTQNKLKINTVLQNQDLQQQQQQLPIKSKNSDYNGIYKQSGRSDFTPRSTAMQIVLDKIDFLGLQPPLDNFKTTKTCNDDGDDNVSETGTYTLDGDNYTEEQKDLMNIDKTMKQTNKELSNYDEHQQKISTERPSDLSLYSKNSQNRKNILEVNYFHESTNLKPKISYLEKIKSKVKNFTKSPDKQQQQMCSSDKGTFTSITTSGILAKKLSLDANPKFKYRKNSLTTSQIDSSEYIGGNNDYIKTSLNNSPYSSGVFTDHEKVEYSLLTKQNSSCSDNDQPPLTADMTSNKSNFNKKNSDTAGLKTAQTKSDWIQEWARNARARSVSTNTTLSTATYNNYNENDKITNDLMSRSYNCEASTENQFINNNDYLQRNKNFPNKINNATTINERKKSLSELILSGRPPLSPSKIPSPMHSVGRARSISKNRGSLQDLSSPISQTADTDIYLQKTAAAITNLSQNLSRKNSLRSLNSMNSPRKGFQYQTNDLFKIIDNNNDKILIHKRNLSLDYRLQQNNNKNSSMSNSYREATLTNDDFRLPRPRINSFDSNNIKQYQYGSPRQQKANNYIDKTLQSIKQHQQQKQSSLSPLRRSSSFSTNKIQTGNFIGGRITPISIQQTQRYNNSQTLTPKNTLQKSASSNSFRKMYSNDYDDSVAYYINDEDDLDYCSSEEFDEPNDSDIQQYNQNEQSQQQQPDIPLTNTRYNKALLMRIENSKQKVAGNITTKPAPGGVMACPNTPEMPRRQNNMQRTSMRQSVPRDSSLNRLKGDVPNSLASAKKQLLQTATINSKPQPRYLDISKYKPQQGSGNTFLKKNESKITLNKNDIRRSPSSASGSLSRNDPSRSSSRSIKSTVNGRPSSALTKRDQSISKQKETELAMWKRRATYDPMKAAAEDKRKKEEAKKLIKTTESSSVLRSQSFHCGVGGLTNLENTKVNLTRRNSQTPDDLNNCWTLISSDEDEEDGTFISSSTNTTN